MQYPIEYKLAEDKSKKNQIFFILIVVSMIALQIITTFISQYWGESKYGCYILCFLNFCSIIFLCLYVFGNNYKIWISSRAFAEAIKSLSWKFAMKVSPFNVSDLDDEKLLKAKIEEILEEQKDYKKSINDALNSNDKYIPDEMWNYRKKNFSDRFLEYNQKRVNDQRQWYKESADKNKKRDIILKIIFVVLIITMFIFTLIHNSKLPLSNVVSIIFNLLLWMQIKKYREINQLYAYTTHNLLKEYKEKISNDDELAEYVQCMENEFTKEHSQWLRYKN